MADPVAFIQARLDEDEDEARDLPALVSKPVPYWLEPYHRRFSAAWVLATVAALRRIVDEHPNVNDGDCGTCVVGLWGYPTHGGSRPENWPCPTLRALAAIWRDHEQFDPAWAPEAIQRG